MVLIFFPSPTFLFLVVLESKVRSSLISPDPEAEKLLLSFLTLSCPNSTTKLCFCAKSNLYSKVLVRVLMSTLSYFSEVVPSPGFPLYEGRRVDEVSALVYLTPTLVLKVSPFIGVISTNPEGIKSSAEILDRLFSA